MRATNRNSEEKKNKMINRFERVDRSKATWGQDVLVKIMKWQDCAENWEISTTKSHRTNRGLYQEARKNHASRMDASKTETQTNCSTMVWTIWKKQG